MFLRACLPIGGPWRQHPCIFDHTSEDMKENASQNASQSSKKNAQVYLKQGKYFEEDK